MVVELADDAALWLALLADWVSIACRSSVKACIKLDILLATADEPVLAMAVELLALELPDACVAWLCHCHQFEYPLTLLIDMAITPFVR